MCIDIDAPEPRSIAKEGRETLQAQIDLAPQMFEQEATYQPRYAALERQKFRDALLGTGGERGVLDIFQRDIAPAFAASALTGQRTQREADIADVGRLGPQALSAIRAANPQQTSLMDEINRQAMSQLQLGATLDPSLRREVQQSVRGGQAARGMGRGPSDVFEEALFTGLQADQLRRQRQGFATQVAGMNAATQQDPFLAILGRPSQTTGMGQQLLGGAFQQGGARQFDPFNPYAADVYNTNYNAQAAADIASGNATASVIGAGLSAL